MLRQFRSATQGHLVELKLADGTTREITPVKPGLSFAGPVYTPDGKALYAVTNQDSDFFRLAHVELATGKVTFVRPDLKWDVDAIALSEDGKYLAYSSNEDGSGKVRILETQSGKDLAAPKLPMGVTGSLQWSSDDRELAVSISSAQSPSDVYSWDIAKSEVQRWTFSETGGLDAGKFSEPDLIRWSSFDGLSVSGFYYKPPARFSGPRPVIISIHGGPEGQSTPGFRGGSNYILNELGVALILPNVRGSSGYGAKFLNLDNGEKREDSVRDIGALLDWIAKQPELDPKRVMVMGGSYGGYMTLASMTHFNDRLCCGVDIVGISNWVTFLERTEAYRRDLRRPEYGDERIPKMRDLLQTISHLSNAAKVTKPMLIIQGRNDPRVPYTESEQMVAAIRKNKGDVWYLLAEDEGHGFAKKKNRDYQSAATVMFIKEHLLK